MTDQDQDNRLLNVIIFILMALSVVYLFFFVPALESEFFLTPSATLEQLGTPTDKFDNLLNKIKGDLGRDDVEIKVIVGPYFRYRGFVGLLYEGYFPTYLILLDADFYNELTPEKQEALVAHEAGHILFKYPRDNSRNAATEVQVVADAFAAKYVHPKHLLSLLDKVYEEYLTRRKHLEVLAQGH